MRNLLLILVIILLHACSDNEKKAEINLKQETDSFYQQVLLDSTILGFIEDNYLVFSDYEIMGPPSVLGSEYNSELAFICDLFNEKDSMFIRSQFKDRRIIDLSVLKIDGVKIVPIKELLDRGVRGDSLWNHVHTNYGNGFYIVSKPIFNRKVTQAYFRIGYMCNTLCGSDITYHMIKDKTGWKVKEELGFQTY